MTTEEKILLWIKELESGNHPQGAGRLKDFQGNYCCLGVYCEHVEKLVPQIIEKMPSNKFLTENIPGIYFEYAQAYPPQRIQVEINKFFNGNVRLGSPEWINYAQNVFPFLNDNFHMTFSEIAGLMKSHIDGTENLWQAYKRISAENNKPVLKSKENTNE